MECKITYTKKRRGYSLLEVMVAMAIFAIASIAITSAYLFLIQGTNIMTNYAVLDIANRNAMDDMTKEIREAKAVEDYSTNPPSITILTGKGNTITYTFDPLSEQLVENSDQTGREVLLNNCQLLNFELFQRCPSNSVFGSFPIATNDWEDTVKVVQLTWRTVITNNPEAVLSSEDVQTARIVIRKQQPRAQYYGGGG